MNNNARDIYLSMKKDNVENVHFLMKKLSETNDAKYIYGAYKNIKNISIEEIILAMIKTKNAKYIYHLAKDLNDKNIQDERLLKAICSLPNSSYIYYYAINICKKHSELLTNAICKTGNARNIYNYYSFFENELNKNEIKEIKNSILKADNKIYKTYLMKDLKETSNNSNDMKNAIEDNGLKQRARILYSFLINNFYNLDITSRRNIIKWILETKNIYYIMLTATFILEKLEKEYLSIENKSFFNKYITKPVTLQEYYILIDLMTNYIIKHDNKELINDYSKLIKDSFALSEKSKQKIKV